MGFDRFYDLSQPVFARCPGWPTYEPVSVTYEACYEKDRFTAEQITLNSHTGTHMDAPFHFYPEGKTIDAYDVAVYQGEAILADLRGKLRPREGIMPEHLSAWESQIKENSILILNTGWGKKRGFQENYMHDWPYLTGEAAVWLRDRKIKGIAIDALSVGGWYEGTGRPCHEILLSAGIWLLEEITVPDELMEYTQCYLMAFPIKWKGFSGAPVRAVAAV